ncbi:hypothetical protein BDM02DRAFT_3117892 [Thelephora ganbajun]|uniref:Uncharacterized protein n=1 Tax=Thelephora ganbajun TaxID=370292 RepID=A0ACB6ZBE9_THEGA|nr:hypothetical protein BDM02DRAFT_3117892 [Thelephora ganbajun]
MAAAIIACHPSPPTQVINRPISIPATDIYHTSSDSGTSTFLYLPSSIPQDPHYNHEQTAKMCARYIDGLFYYPNMVCKNF